MKKFKYIFSLFLLLNIFTSETIISQNKNNIEITSSDYNVNSKISKEISDKNKVIKKLKQEKKQILLFGILLLILFISMFFLAGIRFKKINDKLIAKNSKIGKQRVLIEEQKNRIRERTLDLMVLNKELKENSVLREALTEMIVHDLKNPISNILNISKNKEVKWFAKEMLIMVENILDVKKYKGMLMPLKFNSVHLIKAVNEAVSHISVFSNHKNISLDAEIDENIYVKTDEDIIIRVFINFLSNAVKYTPQNGSVKIEAESYEDNKILIRITDTGIGIKPEKIPLIFNKFSQILARNAGEARSTGIGLTFCKMAVEAHKSKITVKSIPGEYTSFEFFLERANENNIMNPVKSTASERQFDLPKLNFEEINYLFTFYNDLKNKDVYEVGELKTIINKIDGSFSDNVAYWKDTLEKSIFYCNNDLFKKIVSKVNNNQ